MTKGHTAAPLGSFPNLTRHLVCHTVPPVAAPGPGGGLLLCRQTELAGDDVGLNLSWGLGSEGSRKRPITTGSSWPLPAVFLAAPLVRPGPG